MTRRRQKNRQAYWSTQPGLFDTPAPEELAEPLRPMDDAVLEAPEQLRFISFGSGSSGNCAYIGTPSCGLLIDAGVDNNFVTAALASNSISSESIQGILLTHDHSDHVRYAYALLRYNRSWRLFATPKAMNGLLRRHNMSRRVSDFHQPIYKEFPFKVGKLTVTAFETSHDGTDNAGFAIELDGTVFVVTTDTGVITARADHYIRQAQYLMIESDYDADMLRNGRYPQYLKARIASATGHLDNADTGRYLASIAPSAQLKRIFLCHLSIHNNTPGLALGTVRGMLEEAGIAVCHDKEPSPTETRIHISVLPVRNVQLSSLSNNMEKLIDYRNVEILRNEHVALKNVTFTVGEGEFVYLLGRVGSGKTSLLKTMYAEVPVHSGDARVLDYDLCGLPRKQIPFLRRKIGIVFQDFQLLTDRTAFDNLDFVLRATGWKDADARAERIDKVLRLTGMATKAFKMPFQLSGGEQQRIVISRALLNEPRLILADEPTGNLDPDTGSGIMEHLYNVARSTGTAVLVATHNHAFTHTLPGRVLRCERKQLLE